jgi:hypothetical protein
LEKYSDFPQQLVLLQTSTGSQNWVNVGQKMNGKPENLGHKSLRNDYDVLWNFYYVLTIKPPVCIFNLDIFGYKVNQALCNNRIGISV